MIELWVWVATLILVTIAYSALALRYHLVKPEASAVPLATKNFTARLATTNAITYFMFTFLAIFGFFSFPLFIPQALEILSNLWILEAFIVWNIRTAFLIFINLGSLKAKIC